MHPTLRISLVGLGRSLIANTQSKTCLLQGNLAAACFSSRATLHLDSLAKNRQTGYHPSGSDSMIAHYHKRSYSSLYLPSTYDVLSHASKLYTRNLTGTSTSKVCAAHLHTSSGFHQVVDDESSTGTKAGWRQRYREELKSAPTPALVLGFSGLVPFMVPAVYSIITMSCGPNIAFAQVAYGATILSFLGGVRWGYVLTPEESPNWLNLGYSVTPSLVAWMGLMMPIQPGLFCIISGLALAGIVDSRFKAYPLWFRSLRFVLTAIAILSVSVTFAFSIMFPPSEPEHGYNIKKLLKIAQIIVQD